MSPIPRFRTLSSRLFRAKATTFWLIAVAALVVRAGVAANKADDDLVRFAKQFPTPVADLASWSPIGPALGHLVGATTGSRWLVLNFTLLLVVLAATAWMLYRRLGQEKWRVAFMWTCFSSAPAAALQWLGYYDVWMLGAGAMLALGSGWVTAILGGVIFGAANAEQGVLAVLSISAVQIGLLGDGRRREVPRVALRSAACVASIVVVRVLVQTWILHSEVAVPTRAGVFVGLLDDSLRNDISLGTLGLYGWYGVGWLAVWFALRHVPRRPVEAALMFFGVVCIPGLAALTTTDGTRVFATISWAAFLALLVSAIESGDSRSADHLRWAAPVLLVATPLLPSVVTNASGLVESPWAYLAFRLGLRQG